MFLFLQSYNLGDRWGSNLFLSPFSPPLLSQRAYCSSHFPKNQSIEYLQRSSCSPYSPSIARLFIIGINLSTLSKKQIQDIAVITMMLIISIASDVVVIRGSIRTFMEGRRIVPCDIIIANSVIRMIDIFHRISTMSWHRSCRRGHRLSANLFFLSCKSRSRFCCRRWSIPSCCMVLCFRSGRRRRRCRSLCHLT